MARVIAWLGISLQIYTVAVPPLAVSSCHTAGQPTSHLGPPHPQQHPPPHTHTCKVHAASLVIQVVANRANTFKAQARPLGWTLPTAPQLQAGTGPGWSLTTPCRPPTTHTHLQSTRAAPVLVQRTPRMAVQSLEPGPPGSPPVCQPASGLTHSQWALGA